MFRLRSPEVTLPLPCRSPLFKSPGSATAILEGSAANLVKKICILVKMATDCSLHCFLTVYELELLSSSCMACKNIIKLQRFHILQMSSLNGIPKFHKYLM